MSKNFDNQRHSSGPMLTDNIWNLTNTRGRECLPMPTLPVNGPSSTTPRRRSSLYTFTRLFASRRRTPLTCTPSTPGYCYLAWFIHLPSRTQQHVAASLGPCPLVRDVLTSLLFFTGANPLLPGADPVSDSMLHITYTETMWLSEIVNCFMFTDYRIGLNPFVLTTGVVATSGFLWAFATGFHSNFLVTRIQPEQHLAEAATEIATVAVGTATVGFSGTIREAMAFCRNHLVALRIDYHHMLNSGWRRWFVFGFRTLIVWPIRTSLSLLYNFPVLSGCVLTFLCLPYLSRRYERRGLLIYYTLMIVPIAGFFPAWILPIGRGIVNYIDYLLPRRTPPVTDTLILYTSPAPISNSTVWDLSLSEAFTMSGLRQIYRAIADYIVSLVEEPRLMNHELFSEFYSRALPRVGGPSDSDDATSILTYTPTQEFISEDLLEDLLSASEYGVSPRIGGPPDDVENLIKTSQIDTSQILTSLAQHRLVQLALNEPEALAIPSLSLPKKKDYITLSYVKNLSSTHLSQLQNAYPGFNFVASSKLVSNSHEFNAISRRAETIVLYDKYNLFDGTNQIRVHDVGGNVLVGAEHNLQTVHYCNAIIDLRDGARKTTEQLLLDNMRNSTSVSSSVVSRFDGNAHSPYRCLKGVCSCGLKTRIAFEIHVYDIPMEDRLRYFDLKEIEKCHQIVFFHPCITISETGLLRPAGVSWHRYFVDSTEYITFSFLNDPNTAYTHLYESYVAPFVTNVVVTPRGRVYMIERNAPRLNQYEIIYTLVTTCVSSVISDRIKAYHYCDTEDFTLINFYEKISDYYINPDDDAQLKHRRMLVPTEMWEHALRIAQSNLNKKDRLRIINDSLMSFNSKKTIDGINIRTTVKMQTLDIMALAAAADGAVFLTFTQLASGLSKVTDAIKEQDGYNTITIMDIIRGTASGRAMLRFFETIDKKLHDHVKQLEINRPACKINLNEVRNARIMCVDNVVDAAITQLMPRLSKYIPTAATLKALETNTRATLILETIDPSVTEASNRITQRQIARQIPETTDPNVKLLVEKFSRLARDVKARVAPQNELKFVKVPADGRCLYVAMLVSIGVELDPDLPIFDVELIRALLYRVSIHMISENTPKITLDLLPDRTNIDHFTETLKEHEKLPLRVEVSRPDTWASTLHLAIFGEIMRVNFMNYYHTSVQNEKKSVLFALSTTPNSDAVAYISIPLMSKITHTDAWYPVGLPVDLEGRFFDIVTRYLRFDSRGHDSTYDTVEFKFEDLSIKRMELKLLDLLRMGRNSLRINGSILEVGGGPGCWSQLLVYLFPSQRLVSVSPIPEDMDSPLLYSLEAMQLFNEGNRHLYETSFAAMPTTERFDLIISDAATDSSWRNNAILDELMQYIPLRLNQNGSLIAKIPNIVIRVKPFLEWVSNNFDVADLFKPAGSRLNSTEAYLVAGNFKTITNSTLLLTKLLQQRRTLSKNFQDFVCDVLFERKITYGGLGAVIVAKRNVLGYLKTFNTPILQIGGPEMVDSSLYADCLFEIQTADLPSDVPPNSLDRMLSADGLFDLFVNGLKPTAPYFTLLPQSFRNTIARYRLNNDTTSRDVRLSKLRETFFERILPDLAAEFQKGGKLHRCNVAVVKTNYSSQFISRTDMSTHVAIKHSEVVNGYISEPCEVLTRVPLNSIDEISDTFPLSQEVEETHPDVEDETVTVGGTRVETDETPKFTGNIPTVVTPIKEIEELPKPSSPDDLEKTFNLIGTSALNENSFLSYVTRFDSDLSCRVRTIPADQLSFPRAGKYNRVGVFQNSLIITLRSNLSVKLPKRCTRRPFTDPWGNRCLIVSNDQYQIPIIHINREYNDWVQRLTLILTKLDSLSSKRHVHVLFDICTDEVYKLLAVVVMGQTCLRFTFMTNGYAISSPLMKLCAIIRADGIEHEAEHLYRSTFPNQTLMDTTSPILDIDINRITNLRDMAVAAATEFYRYQSRIRDTLKVTLLPIYEQLMKGERVLELTGAGYNLVYLKTGKTLYPDSWGRKFSKLTFAFNGTFIPYNEETESFSVYNDAKDTLGLICADTELMIDELFLSKTKSKILRPEEQPHYLWLNGPPGCGKTHFLLKNFSIKDCAILSATKAGAEEISSKLAQMLTKGSLRERFSRERFIKKISSRVRTIASAMLQERPDKDVVRVFVDEATMVHPGQIVYATLMYPNATHVIMVGDQNQIPFHDRLHIGILQITKPWRIATPLPQLCATFRCPVDVVYSIGNFYNGLYTFNDTLKSMSIQRTTDLPKIPGALYMTFTRAEKQQFQKQVANIENAVLLTVTEAQGLTYDHTIVIREQTNDIEIYNNINQAITAISRHRKTLVYCTRGSSADALEKLMSTAMRQYGSPSTLSNYNTFNKDQTRKTNLSEILGGLHLKIGGPTSVPEELEDSTLVEEFKHRTTSSLFMPVFRFAVRTVPICGSVLGLCYYRGPLTSWRLGNVNSPPPIPPSEIFGMILQRSKFSWNTAVKPVSYGLLICSLLYTSAKVTTYLRTKPQVVNASPSDVKEKSFQSLVKTAGTSIIRTLKPHLLAPFKILGKGFTAEPNALQEFSANDISLLKKYTTEICLCCDLITFKSATFDLNYIRSGGPAILDCPELLTPIPISHKVGKIMCERVGTIISTISSHTVPKISNIVADLIGISKDLLPVKGEKAHYISSADLLKAVPHTVESPYLPTFVYEEEGVPALPVSTYEPIGSVASLQSWYDDFAPTSIGLDYLHDPELVSFSEIDMKISDITLDPGKCMFPNVPFDNLLPTINTMMSAKRPRTQVETLLGFMKRNGNAPKLMAGLPPTLITDLLLSNFINSAIEPDLMDLFLSYTDAPIEPSVKYLDEWVATQDNETVLRFLSQSDVPLLYRIYNVFEYMVKPNVKAPTDPNDALRYQSVQTIAYQPKDVNIIFCPLFIELRNRLLRVMKKKYVYYSGLSPGDLERTINLDYGQDLFDCERVETDISKYDKSMPAYYLLFETALFRMLGLSEELCQIWYNSHVRSIYVDRSSGFSSAVDFQRRSGDASTFLGNTIINHAVSLAIYPDKDIICGLYAGDDHLLFGHNISYSTSGHFADLFNFEAKTLPKYNYPYFCGKFLLPVNGLIYLVPDPIRTLTKFGRRDLRDFDHMEQYRVSMVDVLAPLNNAHIHAALDEAITERYETNRSNHSALINSLLYLISNKDAFAELYYTFDGRDLLSDPSYPDLAI